MNGKARPSGMRHTSYVIRSFEARRDHLSACLLLLLHPDVLPLRSPARKRHNGSSSRYLGLGSIFWLRTSATTLEMLTAAIRTMTRKQGVRSVWWCTFMCDVRGGERNK